MRHVLLVSSLFAVAALTSVEAGNVRVAPASPQMQAVATVPAPQSRLEADEALDGAIGAAVIGAVARDFGDTDVSVKLDRVQVEPASIRDRAVSGEGRVQIGDAQDWIEFRFAALYDTQTASVTQPQLVLGDSGVGKDVDVRDPLANGFESRVSKALAAEFADQRVGLNFDRVRTIPAGARYVRVEAIGVADFGAEGTTPASAQALYDRTTGTWLKVSYELGTTANWTETQVAAL